VWRIVVVVVRSRLAAGMRHVAVALVDCVARARVCVRRWSAAALDDIAAVALALPLARPLSPFAVPVLVALALAEVSVVLTFGPYIVADV
jgi:hypothetical protein